MRCEPRSTSRIGRAICYLEHSCMWVHPTRDHDWYLQHQFALKDAQLETMAQTINQSHEYEQQDLELPRRWECAMRKLGSARLSKIKGRAIWATCPSEHQNHEGKKKSRNRWNFWPNKSLMVERLKELLIRGGPNLAKTLFESICVRKDRRVLSTWQWLQMKIRAFCFALAVAMARHINSPRFSFAFACVMNMLGTHNPQQQATIAKKYNISEMFFCNRFRHPAGPKP